MSNIEVVLKSKEVLTFDGKCTHFKICESGLCEFTHQVGNRLIRLAIIPLENILYIRNYPYMRAVEEKECAE